MRYIYYVLIIMGIIAKLNGENMSKPLENIKIAMLVADGFEQSEMVEPRKALEQAGASVTLISPIQGKVKSFKDHQWSDEFPVDVQLKNARAQDYTALVLPGGVMNPDSLRIMPEAITFIRHFVQANKPIAAICHGPWTLINAGGVQGRTMTSWPSLEADLKNAGASWVNKEVVVDGNLITSRKPSDIPKFNEAIIHLLKTK